MSLKEDTKSMGTWGDEVPSRLEEGRSEGLRWSQKVDLLELDEQDSHRHFMQLASHLSLWNIRDLA